MERKWRKGKEKAKSQGGAIKKEQRRSSYEAKSKTTRHQQDPETNEEEYRKKLWPHPSPSRVNEQECGTSTVTWVGIPWALGEDALILPTDEFFQTDFGQMLLGYFDKTYQEEENPCEIVQVTLPLQKEENRSETLAKLNKLAESQKKLNSLGTYHKEAKPSTSRIINPLNLGDDEETDEHEGSDEQEKQERGVTSEDEQEEEPEPPAVNRRQNHQRSTQPFFHQSQYSARPPPQDRRQEQPRAHPPRAGPPTTPRQGQAGPNTTRRVSYLSLEDYNKLDQAGRDALHAERACVRRAKEIMKSKKQAVITGAYWVGNEIYADVDGKPYLVDTGAEMSMTRKKLTIIGHRTVRYGNGGMSTMPYAKWKGIEWLLGPDDLVTIKDLRELNKPESQRKIEVRWLSGRTYDLQPEGPGFDSH